MPRALRQRLQLLLRMIFCGHTGMMPKAGAYCLLEIFFAFVLFEPAADSENRAAQAGVCPLSQLRLLRIVRSFWSCDSPLLGPSERR